MKRVAIIGTGKLGVRIAEELIRNESCDKLFLWNRSKRRLQGALLSLQIYGSIVQSGTQIDQLHWKSVDDCDLVVLVVKDDYDPRDLLQNESFPDWFPVDVRTVGFRRDAPLVRDVCSMLRNYTGTVVVLTNPLDVMTTFVHQWLPSAQVVGLGVSLDAARLAYMLSKSNVPISGRDECPVGGEHGKNIVLLKSLWNGKVAQNKPSQAILRKALKNAAGLGPKIVQGLGYALHDCAAIFSQDITTLLHLQRPSSSKFLCLSIGDSEAAIGRPVICLRNAQRFSIYSDILDEELKAITAAKNGIAQLVDQIRRSKRFHDMVN